MSNYTKQINWSGKDALADSDPNKVISGDDFDTEFTAIQTAVNTKADLAGSGSQAFNVATAAAGTNTTQAASTAYVTTAIAAIPADDIGVSDVIIDGVTATDGKTIFIDNDAPTTEGADGDVWFEY